MVCFEMSYLTAKRVDGQLEAQGSSAKGWDTLSDIWGCLQEIVTFHYQWRRYSYLQMEKWRSWIFENINNAPKYCFSRDLYQKMSKLDSWLYLYVGDKLANCKVIFVSANFEGRKLIITGGHKERSWHFSSLKITITIFTS